MENKKYYIEVKKMGGGYLAEVETTPEEEPEAPENPQNPQNPQGPQGGPEEDDEDETKIPEEA